MGRFFLIIFLVCGIPLQLFAGVYLSSLLPNPVGDDTLGEYIEIRNTGCESVDISGYILSDASKKTYTIPSGTIVVSREAIRFIYATTNIALNNSGDESVFLKDVLGGIVDEVHYSGTQKDDITITLLLTDEVCPALEELSTESGDTETGSTEQFPSGGSGTTQTRVTNTGVLGSPWTQDDGNIGTWASGSGDIELSGSIDLSSGTIDSWVSFGSGITDSGSSSSGTFATWSLFPQKLFYSDNDGNGKIDTLEIEYEVLLTGSVDASVISLYSRTGWLYTQRVNTETGYILSWSPLGYIFTLYIRESDFIKDTLIVKNTTSSDLRLKSSWNLGISSLDGRIIEPFLLTISFDSYKNVFAGSVGTKITGTLDFSYSTGSGQDPTQDDGAMETGITNSTWSTISSGSATIPEIIPTFQNYTNTTNSGDILTCTTMPCRVNFTLEPIFTGTFLEKDFTCQITFWTWVYNTCNPPQLYPISPGDIDILITDKATWTSTGKILPITMDIDPVRYKSAIWVIVPTNNQAPIANIDMDGKWKKYFTSPEVNLLRCYAFTCSVNFSGENSYDPDGNDIHFLWLYDFTNPSTSKDPGVRTFTIGTHTVILRAIDTYGAVGEVKYTIEVISPTLMPEKEKVEVVKKVKEKKGKEISVTKEETSTKKKKLKPILFFDPPDIFLQNKNLANISIAGKTYICRTRTKTCSMNFFLTGAQKGYTYEWEFPGQSGAYISKNPRSFAFLVWTSEIHLTVRDLAGNILSEDTSTVVVEKIIKPRKAKKPKKKVSEKIQKPKVNSSSQESIVIPEVPEDTSTQATSIFFLLLGGTGIGWVIRAMKRRRSIR